MSGGLGFLFETLRTRNGTGDDDEWLIEDHLAHTLDTATAPTPGGGGGASDVVGDVARFNAGAVERDLQRFAEGTLAPVVEGDPIVPLDTATADAWSRWSWTAR